MTQEVAQIETFRSLPTLRPAKWRGSGVPPPHFASVISYHHLPSLLPSPVSSRGSEVIQSDNRKSASLHRYSQRFPARKPRHQHTMELAQT
jgi:hypothetical protein